MVKIIQKLGADQFIMVCNGDQIFQSYKSIIAIMRDDGTVSLSRHYDFSRTTMRYLSKFLGHGIAETRKHLKTGKYKLDIDTDGYKL